jgi:NADPH2:quinone reductase
MKAIVVREFGEPDVMKLEDVADLVPSAVEVLVRIEAAGVNPVDTYIRSGLHAQSSKLPYTPGKDAAGTIEAVGPGVSTHKPGERVYVADSITGTYAEFALCRADQVGELPPNVSFEQGAGLWVPYATSYRALFQKAKAVRGEKVLVHGASGGVGIAAVQWAVDRGLEVFGTAGSEEGKQLVKSMGAAHVLDHNDPDHLRQLLDLTGGRGVDVVIEKLADANLQRDFEGLAMFGRLVIVGSRGSLDFRPRSVMSKDATIYGMALFNASPAEMMEIHKALHEGLVSGYLQPVVSRTFPLSDAAAAHKEIIASRALGKIVLIP